MRQVPKLNNLYEEFGSQGLVIVGVSNESDALIAPKLESVGFNFPVARVVGGKADSAYGVTGFPTMVLIAPDGTVASSGRISNLRSQVAELVRLAVLVPKLESKAYSSINRLIDKRAFGKAHASLTRAMEKAEGEDLMQLQASLESIDQLATNRLARTRSFIRDEFFAQAAAKLRDIEEDFQGMSQAAAAKESRKMLEAVPDAKDDFKAYKLLETAQAALAKSSKAASRRKAKGILERIVKDYPHTATAKIARGLLKG